MRNYLIPLFITFVIHSVSLFSQQSNIDSLDQLLNSKTISKPEQMEVIYKLCYEYVYLDLKKSEENANKLFTLSKKYKSKNYEAKALHMKGNVYYMKGILDSALYYYNSSLVLYEKEKLNNEYYRVVNNIANIYSETGKPDSSIYYYNNALNYYETTKMESESIKILANLGSLYYMAYNLKKAIELTLKALELQRKNKDVSGMIVSLSNLMTYACDQKNYIAGIKYGKDAAALAKDQNMLHYADILISLSTCYYELNDIKKATRITSEAIDIYKQNKSKRGLIQAYRAMAECQIGLKDYKTAKEFALLSFHLTDTTNRQNMRIIYQVLKQISIYLNEHNNALYYSDKQMEILQADFEDQWSEKISDAEARYENEKKEKRIIQLQAQKRIRSLLFISTIILLFLVLTSGFFIYKSLRNRKMIAEQKIKQLEQEKLLLATQSVLKGEESERQRIARDLHDGLGGLLTGLKFKFNNMKGNVILAEDSVNEFDHALELLDNSIAELRRIAHNMMPESLVKLGLKDALNDFCESFKNTYSINISFQFIGDFKRIEQQMEINAFRILQELVNNALKHSKANQILVHIIQDENRLGLIVQDDGCGFDVEEAKKGKGIGLSNIFSRVIAMKGSIDVFSKPGEGSEVSVNFFI